MADIQIENDQIYGSFYRTWSFGGLVWTDTLTAYIFFLTETVKLVYRKTEDGGATWGDQVPVGGDVVSFAFGIWFDKWTPGDTGNKIHITYLHYATEKVQYNSLDTSDDSLSGEVTITQRTDFYLSGAYKSYCVSSIVKSRAGNLYVGFWGSGKADQHGFYKSADGSSWTVKTDVADGDAIDEIIFMPGNEADTDDIWCIYWDRTANEITLKVYDQSDNSWSETTILSAADNTSSMQFRATQRHSDNHVLLAFWGAFNVATADLKFYDIGSTSSIVAKTEVLTDSDDSVVTALLLNQDDDSVYAVYIRGTSYGSLTSIYYKKSTDGGDTWGDEVKFSEDAEDDLRNVWAGISVGGNEAGGKFQPIWNNTDLGNIFTNTDNGITITAPTIQTITAKASIFNTQTQTVTSKGDIKKTTNRTIQSKAKINIGWLSGWTNRIKITVDNTDIDDDLTHFPLPLFLGTSVGKNSDDISCIFDEVGANYKKIAVTKSDGITQRYVEVEKWDNGNEKAVLWVSKSDLVLFKDSNTILYIYYDNTQDDNSSYVGDVGSRTEVWNSNYKIVYHLKESAGNAIDSTGGFDKAYLGNLPDEVDGKIGYGQDFDGTGDYIDVGEHASLNPVTFTVQAWVNSDSFTSDDWKDYLASKEGANTGWALRIGDAYPNFMVGDGGATPQAKSSTKIFAGTWYLITGVYDGDYIKVYENYTEKDSVSSGSYSITANSLFVGEYIWRSRAVDGQLDEFRYSDIARNAAWIKVDYYAQDDNLVSYGEEELRISQTITAKASIYVSDINQTLTAKGNIITGIETKTQTINTKGRTQKQFTQTIEPNGRIGLSTNQTLTANARIGILSTQTITALSRITATTSQEIESKSNLKVEQIQTINAKSAIFKSFNQTVLAVGRIQKSKTRTINVKARIQIGGKQTIFVKSAVLKNYTQTITTKSRIQKVSTQTLAVKSRIQLITNQTTSAKGIVQITNNRTFLSLGRIAISSTQTITALARITQTEIKTINAKARININSTQTIDIKGDIKVTQIQGTFYLLSENGSHLLQENGSRIIIEDEDGGINAKARIKRQFTQTITAKGRIQITTTQNVQTKASIKKTNEQQIDVNARISVSRTQTVNTKARITISSEQTLTAKGRITATQTQTVVVKGDVKTTQTRNIQSKGRVQKSFTQSITTKGRITIASSQSIEAKASIFKSITRTISAKASIFKTFNQTIQALGRIEKPFLQTITASADIKKATTRTLTAKGRIQLEGVGATIDAKGNVKETISQTIQAKSAILRTFTQTVSIKGRIEIGSIQSVQAKGRIGIASTQLISAKARITTTHQQTLTAKGNIKTSQIQTIETKGRITIASQQNISAKAIITINSLQTIEAQGDIKKTTTQIIIVKSRIQITTTRTIQTKAIVLKLSTKTISAKGKIITWRVVDIIDKVRDQKIIEEITYVKEKVGEISYNKVEASNIVGVSTRVGDIPRTRPVIKEISEPSRVIQIKWVTVKAKIRR